MKPRYTIKAALALTAGIASAFGWYAYSASAYRSELQAIASLDRDGGVTEVVASGKGLGLCGSWTGAIIRYDETGPKILNAVHRELGINVFRRVTSVDFIGEVRPKLLAHLPAFTNLARVSFDYDQTNHYYTGDEIAELVGAIRLYAALYPHVDVEFPHRGMPSATELAAKRYDVLLGDDPFDENRTYGDLEPLDDPFAD